MINFMLESINYNPTGYEFGLIMVRDLHEKHRKTKCIHHPKYKSEVTITVSDVYDEMPQVTKIDACCDEFRTEILRLCNG